VRITMLSLDSPKWSELVHAYGMASNIPHLLRQLETMPPFNGKEEPWSSIWSSLAHQGDVYSASFAAVPHVVRILALAPNQADFSYFQFPAWVEICRQKKSVMIPQELETDYFSALKLLPSLVAAAADREWDEAFLLSALSAIAAAKGYGKVAEAIQELNASVAEKFMDWLFSQ
jgi:hypothetical protein